MNIVDSFSQKYKILDEQIVACYEKIKCDSPEQRKRAVDEFKIFRSSQMDFQDEIEDNSYLASSAKVKELMADLRTKLQVLKAFIDTPAKKDNDDSLMQITAAALGSAFGSGLAGSVMNAFSASQQPPEISILPPNTVFRTITPIDERVDSQAPASVTQESILHSSLPAPAVHHSETQQIAFGHKRPMRNLTSFPISTMKSCFTRTMKEIFQRMPAMPIPVLMGFSSSAPIPGALGTKPNETAVSTSTIKRSIRPSTKPIETVQPTSTQQELNSEERLRKIATDPNRMRVPSELPTLEEALRERGLEFADGTGKPETQATAQTVRWSRWFGPTDKEVNNWGASIHALEKDAEAKRAPLPGLAESADLSRENLNKAWSQEEILAYTEEWRIANGKFEECLREAKEASEKFRKAVNHDARQQAMEKKYFKKGDLLHRKLQKSSRDENNFQKECLDPALKIVTSTNDIIEQIVASNVHSVNNSLISSSLLSTKSRGMLLSPSDAELVGQSAAVSLYELQPFSRTNPSLIEHEQGVNSPEANRLLPNANDFSSMPLTSYNLLDKANKALSLHQPAPAFSIKTDQASEMTTSINRFMHDSLFDSTLQAFRGSETIKMKMSVPHYDSVPQLRMPLDYGAIDPAPSPLDLSRTAAFYAGGALRIGKGSIEALALAQRDIKGLGIKIFKAAGNLQKQVEQGKAPKSIERVDKGRGLYERDHIHFNDGSALNVDGTWKHGGKELTKSEIIWIQNNGWNLPGE